MSNTPTAPARFTKTETRRRLTALAAMARQHDRDIKSNDRAEVGLRTIHQISDTVDGATAWVDGDDLADQVGFGNGEAAADPDCQIVGSVLHIYFASPGAWGELKTTVTGWIGTHDTPPAIIDVPTRYKAPGRQGHDEPGIPAGVTAAGRPIVDTTTPTAIDPAEVARRAEVQAARFAEREAADRRREAAIAERAARHAAGEFRPGEIIKAPAVVAGYGAEAWRPAISVEVVEVIARPNGPRLMVKHMSGHGNRPLMRMTAAEAIARQHRPMRRRVGMVPTR